MENDHQSASPVPLWPFLLLCAATALGIDFGTIHRLHQADSIVPILTSLYHWTPYYWGTNRNGMLVPFLAIPFKHPLVNLLVQDGLTIFSGLATLFLLPRYVLRNASWPYAAIVSTAAFLVFAPEQYRFSFLVDQPYAVSLALGLGGLILTERTPEGKSIILRSGLALLLIGLAHWVNVGIGLVLGILVVLRALLIGSEENNRNEEAFHALILLAIGFCLGLIGMQLARYHETAEGIRSPHQWIQGWSRLASNTWVALAPHRWPILLMLMAALGLFVPLFARAPANRISASRRGATVLILTAILYAAFVGVLEWVERGSFTARYTIPSVILIHSGLSVLAASALSCLRAGAAGLKLYAVTPVLLMASIFGYGWPSFSGVQDDLNRRLGSRTVDVVEGRCTHVVGNYWIVWPTVFHANLLCYQRGESGVSRSEVIPPENC